MMKTNRVALSALIAASLATSACSALGISSEPPLTFNTDGPAVCLNKAIEHLGPDAMVSDIDSYFTWDDSEDADGTLDRCEAYYQDPNNPTKLLVVKMSTSSHKFGDPQPVELSVSGAGAGDFDLNDYVIPASSINTTGIQPAIEQQDARVADVYSTWHWEKISLRTPDQFSDVHVFDLRLNGRLAKNDLEEGGYVFLPTDGSTELAFDSLLPS